MRIGRRGRGVVGGGDVACLPLARRRPHVLVPRRHRPVEGIVIHHCVGLDPRDVTVARGIPVTTVARMLVDLGAVLTAHQLCWVINEATFRGN